MAWQCPCESCFPSVCSCPKGSRTEAGSVDLNDRKKSHMECILDEDFFFFVLKEQSDEKNKEEDDCIKKCGQLYFS